MGQIVTYHIGGLGRAVCLDVCVCPDNNFDL